VPSNASAKSAETAELVKDVSKPTDRASELA
jgi:hypothetical protein